MIETETQHKENKPPEIKPCIFGSEVQASCPVRCELAKADPMKKYIKPTGDFSEIMSAAQDLMDKVLSKEWTLLHQFCSVCPFLTRYENHLLEKK